VYGKQIQRAGNETVFWTVFEALMVTPAWLVAEHE